MRDADSDDGLTQARYELRRAQDFGGQVELARWAERWGGGLLETAESRVQMRELTEDGCHYCGGSTSVNTDAVDEALTPVREELNTIAAVLRGPARDLDVSDLVERFEACTAGLAKADEELEKL